MADPVKTLRSLEELASTYSVFERDQVLTEAQLNSLSRYFDDQGRLSRVELVGVGLIGGLRAAVSGGKLRVSRGLGLTTDGDLLFSGSDAVFDSIKPYDESAPFYAPFYKGNSMLPLWELVREGESDVLKQPLATLPGSLTEYVVVFYMESFEQDHDLCSGTDCDNLGITATHTPRFLLVRNVDAAGLANAIATLTQKASQLPVLAAERPAITGALTTTAALATLFRNTSNTIHTAVTGALDELHKQIPVLTQDLFGGDPSPAWIARLTQIRSGFQNSNLGVQYWYDFLKDLVETWNALRDALLDNDSVLCPDLSAFPKHLMLGELGNPAQLRTPFYPSPVAGSGRAQLEHAHFLAKKLHVLIHTFQLPATSPAPALTITPSRSEAASLEDRAIPYYYLPAAQFPLLATWSWQRTRRGTTAGITAYRAQALGAKTNPLTVQIGEYDFFRIEGHLGQNVDTVMDNLEAQIAQRNLPFAVRAVLVHAPAPNVTPPFKRRPPMRYGDLHRMHRLFRAEVDSEVQRVQEFSPTWNTRIKSAAANKQFPNETVRANQADTLHNNLSAQANAARSAFSTKRYSQFRSNSSWQAAHDNVVQTASHIKRDFGDIARTDFSTPFDYVATTNHRKWLDWLDLLIEDKDRKADERLLLTNYLKQNPGLEHAGGVLRGGTFVVVYDDNATVVADLSLAYREVEEVEPEDDEPALTYQPRPWVIDSFVITKPLEWRFDDLRVDIAKEWKAEIDIQHNYTKFFREELITFGGIFGNFTPKATDRVPGYAATGDQFLDGLIENMYGTKAQIDKLRGQAAAGNLPDEVQGLVEQQILVYEQAIAQQAQQATGYMAQKGGDALPQQAVVAVGQAVGGIKDEETLKQVEAGFQQVAAKGLAQQNIARNVAKAGGMKISF